MIVKSRSRSDLRVYIKGKQIASQRMLLKGKCPGRLLTIIKARRNPDETELIPDEVHFGMAASYTLAPCRI